MGTGKNSIHAVVFDLGGVLLDWNPRYLYRKLFDDEATMENFLREICTPEWHSSHDRGESTDESCAELANRYPEYAKLIWAWSRRGEEMIAGQISGSVDVLRELKATGLRCYALTNMEAETYPSRLKRFAFLSWFDGTVVSGNEGIAKPDTAIYVRTLERFDLSASTTLVIDDNSDNVESAANLGMQTLLFESPGQLRQELEHKGLLPP